MYQIDLITIPVYRIQRDKYYEKETNLLKIKFLVVRIVNLKERIVKLIQTT